MKNYNEIIGNRTRDLPACRVMCCVMLIFFRETVRCLSQQPWGYMPNNLFIMLCGAYSSFFDVRHLRCLITKLTSNWETVINTTKVYYYS
jgi:hypothetical protein